MKTIIFRAFLAAILTMLFPVVASACSVPPFSYPWIPHYGIYSHLEQKDPLGKYDFIGLVTAELMPVEEARFEYYYGRNPKASSDQYATVKFNISEVLKGPEKAHFFQGQSRKLASGFDNTSEQKIKFEKSIIKNPNKLTDADEIVAYNEAKRIAELRSGAHPWGPKDFHEKPDFRDLFDLSMPRLQRPYRGGMCGDEFTSTIFEGITYLAFKSGERMLHLEPVNTEKDALVDWTRDELSGKESDFLKMGFKDLFKSTSSNRYAVIEITECPSQDRVLKNVEKKLPFITETIRFKSMSRKSSYTPKLKYAKFDVLIGNVKHRDVSLSALENYMKFIGSTNFQCRKGRQYLAFGRPKQNDARYAYSGFRSQPDIYNWRFMRIEKEHVLLEDFRTNLKLTGSRKIHLSEIIK